MPHAGIHLPERVLGRGLGALARILPGCVEFAPPGGEVSLAAIRRPVGRAALRVWAATCAPASLRRASLFAFPGRRLRAGGAPANDGTVKSVNGMKIHFALFMFFTFFTVERKAPSGMRPSCWTWFPHIRAARLGAKKGDGAARPERNRRAVGRVSKKGPHAAPSAWLTEERCSHSARPARRAVRAFTARPPYRGRGCRARRRASPGRRSRRTGPRGGRPWRGRRAGARRPGRRRGRGSP